MSNELKACPFCGKAGMAIHGVARCVELTCPMSIKFDAAVWNTRPIEDQLRADLAAARKEQQNNARIASELLLLIGNIDDDYDDEDAREVLDRIRAESIRICLAPNAQVQP